MFKTIRLSRCGRKRGAMRVANRAFCLAALLTAGCSSFPPSEAAKAYEENVSAPILIDLPNPGEAGRFAARSYLYGSRRNPRRPEYAAAKVTVVTEPVDVSRFFGRAAPRLLDQVIRPNSYYDRVNKRYWGYDQSSVPVNGKLWYPEGEGPFPLIVCVHGNHDPLEASEFGYDYLGSHLASHGMIFASIDENFLNGPSDGRENDARAALILIHAREIIRQSGDPSTPIHGKVDPSRIGIMGHSRGGEAAATAAIFNELGVNPDDASVSFAPMLDIRGVVSIAPIEGQYRASQKALMFSSADFLSLHGSADGDVAVDMASRFLNRGAPAEGHFRSSFWIFGANHGSFNSTWSEHANELPTFASNRLGTAAQQKACRVLVTAFFEASFGMEPRYREFLRDWRAGRDWLPTTVYASRWREGGDRAIADFEEDADLRTGTASGWEIEASGFARWSEAMLPLEMGAWFYKPEVEMSTWWGNHQESCAVFLQTGKGSGRYAISGPSKPCAGIRLDIGVHGVKDPFEVPAAAIRVHCLDGRIIECPLEDRFRILSTPKTWTVSNWAACPFEPQTVTIPLDPGSEVTGISIEFGPAEGREWYLDRIVAYGEDGAR